MAGACTECGAPYIKGVCPKCGTITLAARALQAIPAVANGSGRFNGSSLKDVLEEQGKASRAQVAAALIILFEWGAIGRDFRKGPNYRLTSKGRRMIEVGATHKFADLTKPKEVNRMDRDSSAPHQGCNCVRTSAVVMMCWGFLAESLELPTADFPRYQQRIERIVEVMGSNSQDPVDFGGEFAIVACGCNDFRLKPQERAELALRSLEERLGLAAEDVA